MKLREELKTTVAKFDKIGRENIMAYAEQIKKSGRYKCLLTRVSWDMFWVAYTNEERTQLYEKYDCNDSHISTLLKNAFKQLNISL